MVKEINHRLTGNDSRMDRFRKVWIAVERTLLLARDAKFLCKILESDTSSSTLSDGGECLRGDEERSEGKDESHLKIATMYVGMSNTPGRQKYSMSTLNLLLVEIVWIYEPLLQT
jgi:hypothetical protein